MKKITIFDIPGVILNRGSTFARQALGTACQQHGLSSKFLDLKHHQTGTLQLHNIAAAIRRPYLERKESSAVPLNSYNNLTRLVHFDYGINHRNLLARAEVNVGIGQLFQSLRSKEFLVTGVSRYDTRMSSIVQRNLHRQQVALSVTSTARPDFRRALSNVLLLAGDCAGSQAVFVSDNAIDLASAKELGIKTIAVNPLHGLTDDDYAMYGSECDKYRLIREVDPDLIVNTVEELDDLTIQSMYN